MDHIDNQLQAQVNRFCDKTTLNFADFLSCLKKIRQKYEKLEFFHEEDSTLVLKAYDNENQQNVGLVVYHLNSCDEIEGKRYTSNHKINQADNQIQFSYVLESFLIQFESTSKEGNIKQNNESQDQNGYFVQAVQMIISSEYKYENRIFPLDEINEENFRYVKRIKKIYSWMNFDQETSFAAMEQSNIQRNLTYLNYSSEYQDLEIVQMTQLFTIIQKCHNLVDLSLNIKISSSLKECSSSLSQIVNQLQLSQFKLHLFLQSGELDDVFELSFKEGLLLSGLDFFLRAGDDRLLNLNNLGRVISKLTNLNTLSFKLKGISQETEICSVLKDITNCQNLISLNLYLGFNFLGDQWVQELSDLLGKQTFLKHLDLTIEQGEVNEKTVQTVISSLQYCRYLTRFNLSFLFSDAPIEIISPELVVCKSIKHFKFNLIRSSNNMPNTKEFFNNLALCSNISDIHLGFHSFLEKSDIINDCCSMLQINKNIESITLCVEGDQFYEYKPEQVFEEIPKLKKFSFQSNMSLENHRFLSFVNLIEKAINIQCLDLNLSGSALDQSDLIALGEKVSKLQFLKEFLLNLNFNDVACGGIVEFSNALAKNVSIQKLDLRMRHCEISIPNLNLIAKAIILLPSVNNLRLNVSSVTKETAQSISNILNKSQTIKYLTIGLNQEMGKSVRNLTPLSQKKMKYLVNMSLNSY